MPTITLSRQLGSLGEEVAQAIAARLGYRLMCRDVINMAAIRAGAPEVALATIDDLGLLGIQPSRKDLSAYRQALSEVMNELADAGEVVLVGRAGQVILAGRQDVLNVKVIAPRKLRAQRIARSEGIPLKSAMARVKASDQSRKRFLRSNYKARWDDPALYDLIVNTARLTPEQAGQLVCRALVNCTMDNTEDDVDSKEE